MTASTVKSTDVTTIQGKGVLRTHGTSGVVRMYEDSAPVATTSIDEANDIMLALALPANCILKSLKLFNTDMDTHSTPTLAVNVGIAHGEGTGTAQGTAIDVDLFASAITTLQAANLVGVEILHESGDITLLECNKPLWEQAGLSAEVGGYLVVQVKVTTEAATAAAGTIKLQALVV